ncbi:hypothetical protein AR687_23725 [Flavobacteriaceae bacterium CRH]|nr:hypothetical protein AR687_23725 [Flavobacteriaceae bacterium CRH]
MELKFTLFIKFALSPLIILALLSTFWNKFRMTSKFNFNLIANLFYKFKHYESFLFPNPGWRFRNEKHWCV